MTVEFAQTYPAEAADPYCLHPEQLDELLEGAGWQRFVVIGDSVAKGVHEEKEGYASPTWGERVAIALRRQQPDLVYENYGVIGMRTDKVRETQLDRALAFEPDLTSVVTGGNDMLARRIDWDRLEGDLDAIVAGLSDSGADVITFTMFNIHAALDMPPEMGEELRIRLERLADLNRAVARRHQTIHVELFPHPACAEPDIYASDFQHGSSRGQAIVASVTVEALGAALAERRERG